MEYKIIYASTLDSVVEIVNSRIRNGWVPQGGICYSGQRFYQAIIKHEPN
jgi:hypothetical protein